MFLDAMGMDVGPDRRRRNSPIWTGLFLSEAGCAFFAALALDKRSAGCHQISGTGLTFAAAGCGPTTRMMFCDGCL
jgi:hypothetical protein